MARPILTLTLLFVASACRDQSAPAGGSDGAAAADAGPTLSLPPEIQTATAVCALKTEQFLPLNPLALTATGTTPPFAEIGNRAVPGSARKYPRAELGITSDDDLPFGLRVVGGAEIKAFVPRTFPVHPSGPLALGKFAAALPHTSLKVTRATNLEVEVEAQLGDTVESLEGPLRARGPCGLFAIERRDFNATAVIPGVKWKQEPDALLKRGKKIPLTVLPIGEPAARLEIGPNDNPAIVVFEKQNGRAHVAWFGGSVLVHGWIAESELSPLPKAAPAASASASASVSASAAPATSAPPAAALSRHTCPEAVPLIAQTGESRTTVGTLRATTAFDVLAKEKGWASVRVEVPLFTVAPGARLVVRESDLAACTTAKENPR